MDELNKLFPSAEGFSEEASDFFGSESFPDRSIRLLQPVLEAFGAEGIEKIVRIAADELQRRNADVRILSFRPLVEQLRTNRDGRNSVNVYRQRIIERYLSDPETYGEHLRPEIEISGPVAGFSFRFAPACEKLIDFCVESEHSGLLSYERNIAAIFDLFGFRRDGFDRLANEESYLGTMNSSAARSGKRRIPDLVTGDTIVDIGSGGGILLNELERRFPDKQITGTDVSANVIETLLKKRKRENRKWKVLRHNIVDAPLPREADCIVFSSSLHEIYSYTKTDGRKFNPESVRKALRNAVSSLNPGGRIIIRDGVRAAEGKRIRLCFLTDGGMRFFRQFAEEFRGFDAEPEAERHFEIDAENNAVTAGADYAREFLYTCTWGPESFAHEVQERHGFFRADEFAKTLEELGMRVVEEETYFEKGYGRHLAPLVKLEDPDTGEPVPFPDSTCMIVAEKP